jgi:hypothetical protein
MKNRKLPLDNNWATPKSFYDALNKEFNFDHDPCPFNTQDITPETDGLNYDNKWGKFNFVNPPYEKKIKEAFVNRAIEEAKQGRVSVLLLPVSTSTKLFHEKILPNSSDIRFIKGRIKFQKYDEDGNLYTPKNGGMHDSMVVVIGKLNNDKQPFEKLPELANAIEVVANNMNPTNWGKLLNQINNMASKINL